MLRHVRSETCWSFGSCRSKTLVRHICPSWAKDGAGVENKTEWSRHLRYGTNKKKDQRAFISVEIFYLYCVFVLHRQMVPIGHQGEVKIISRVEKKWGCLTSGCLLLVTTGACSLPITVSVLPTFCLTYYSFLPLPPYVVGTFNQFHDDTISPFSRLWVTFQ